MHSYLFDTELVRISIILGIVVSILYYNMFGVTTGGAIVPGYLALFIPSPGHIVATLLLAILTYWLVQKFFRPRFMLWGRRLFETEVLVALGLQAIWLGLLFFLSPYIHALSLLYGIGFLIPAVIAHDMGRQHIKATLQAAIICALIVFGILTLIGAAREIFGLSDTLIPPVYYPQTYAYPVDWLLLGISVGVLISIILYRYNVLHRVLLGDALRTGGFVTAGYLALFVTRPLDLLFVIVCAGVTYLIVTKIFMKHAILFGRSKMAAMFLTGFIVTWLAEILLSWSSLQYIPWEGFSAITPAIVSLLANDAQRQGPPRTFAGVGIATLMVAGTMIGLHEVYTWLLQSDYIFNLMS